VRSAAAVRGRGAGRAQAGAAAAKVGARVSPGSLRKPETILCFCLKIPKIVLHGIYNSSHLIIGKYSNNSNNATKVCTWALGAPSGRGPLATSRPSPCIVHAHHNNFSPEIIIQFPSL
jgi:hypothetical protein